jgi:hypothetical protein
MKTGWRAALVLLGLILAAASVWQLRSFRGQQDRLDRLARASGALAYEPGLPEGLAREPDPWHARLRLARALFASASAVSPTEPEAVDTSPAAALRRLELAHRLAARVAVERPSSWEAAMIQGASAYLGWSLQRDRRLLTEPEEWEAPLLRSLEVAPGRPEPVRFLAAAYLELWPVLSRGKKESARSLMARALADPRTFEALIEPWLRTADSRAQAFSAIPRAPWAWGRMQQIEAADSDWDGYREARLRWYDALERSMRSNLAEAEARLQGGDAVRAQLLFLSVLQVPPRRRFLPYVESAIAQCPPGPGVGSFARYLQVWLDWSLDLCHWKGCPMPEPMLRRLAGLAGTPGIPGMREAHEANTPRQFADLRRNEWSFRHWTLRERTARLEVVPATASPGLTIEILELPNAGAAVEVRLDGDVAAISGARRGDVIAVRRPLRPGLAYVLEIEAVSGELLVPGAVRLLPGAS